MSVKIKLSIKSPSILSNIREFLSSSKKISNFMYEIDKDFMMVDLLEALEKDNIDSTFITKYNINYIELVEQCFTSSSDESYRESYEEFSEEFFTESVKEDISVRSETMGKRIEWEEFFMEQAVIFSKRATCNRLKVGVIITTKDNMQLAEGYNGSISGHAHCDEDGCLLNGEGRCIRTIHAEQNALLNAMKKGVSVVGGTAYVTHEPCETCTKLLLQSGINEIVYLVGYDNEYNKAFLENSKVIFREFNGDGKERLMNLIKEIRG